MNADDLLARILHRDAMMLVIDKPFGIAVHKGPKAAYGENAEVLEQHFDALKFGLPRAPSLAHRLDRDTSGCLVLGRHRRALEELGNLFKDGKIAKTYWAVVEGEVPEDAGLIDLPLAKRDVTRGWWMKVDPDGLPSQTRWTVLGRAEAEGRPLVWLALEPLTGRTHQLRAHCAAVGAPILGDTVYGKAPRIGGPGLHLHARAVSIPLYKNKPPVEAEAPPPPHMRAMLEQCGWSG